MVKVKEYFSFDSSHVYALYWGVTNDDWDKDGDNPCYILKFDWTGTLQAGYRMDRLLRTFAVDESTNTIYDIPYSDEEDPVLLKFKM